MDLVTGATGIVGAHVVSELLLRGNHVRAIARGAAKRKHLLSVLAFYSVPDACVKTNLELVDIDILNVDDLADAVTGCTYVYHCAAMVSFAPHEREHMWKVNVEGTANVVNACNAKKIKRLCHVSSVAAIGRKPDGELSTERDAFEEAPHVSPYSHTKYHAELEVQRGIAEGLDAFMVNPCVIVGPGIKGQSSMALIDKVSGGSFFYPSGTAAIVDARDVALALVEGATKAVCGERYLTIGSHMPYKDLFALIAEAAGVKKASNEVPRWALEIAWRLESLRNFVFKTNPIVTKYTVHSACSHYYYSNEKATQVLGIGFREIPEIINHAIAFRKSQKTR